MAPADKPSIVALVLLDEPSQFKYGGQSAAPIFREMVDRLLTHPEFPLARAASAPVSATPATAPGRGDSSVVPDLLGYRQADAMRVVAASGLAVRLEGEGEVVLTQDPRPGSRIPSSGSLTLSLGYLEARTMPELDGNTLRDALLKLKNLGLDVEYTGAGRIIRQEPAAGTAVKPGQKCVLTLGWMG
jgi:stage V sporulation protein D (sporulation-specific penicillin-binding protein)